MQPIEKPIVENLYQHFNWRRIWSNFCELKIRPFDKEIIYKHLHVCLATNSRLAWFNLANSNTCNLCRDDKEQTALHIFYECTYISPFYQWLLNVLVQICHFKPDSNIRFLYFDCLYANIYQRRVCNLFLAIYISIVWRKRKENLRIGVLKKVFIKTVYDNMNIRKQVLHKSLEEIYGQYSARLTYVELNKL